MKTRMGVSYHFLLLLVLCSCGDAAENQVTKNDVYRSIMSDVETPVPFVARDCGDLYLRGYNTSGLYTIQPLNWDTEFGVYCDMHTDQGGWTVFQRRGDYFGFPDDYFHKTWAEYKDGFGDLSKEFWLGNDRIFALTRQGAYQLRVDLWDATEIHGFAKYGRFWIANETELYQLHIGGYSGTAGDGMLLHNLNQFATKDHGMNNCAKGYKGAWWNSIGCHHVNLNGMNYKGPFSSSADGITWYYWKGQQYSIPFTELKVRPREFLRLI